MNSWLFYIGQKVWIVQHAIYHSNSATIVGVFADGTVAVNFLEGKFASKNTNAIWLAEKYVKPVLKPTYELSEEHRAELIRILSHLGEDGITKSAMGTKYLCELGYDVFKWLDAGQAITEKQLKEYQDALIVPEKKEDYSNYWKAVKEQDDE